MGIESGDGFPMFLIVAIVGLWVGYLARKLFYITFPGKIDVFWAFILAWVTVLVFFIISYLLVFFVVPLL